LLMCSLQNLAIVRPLRSRSVITMLLLAALGACAGPEPSAVAADAKTPDSAENPHLWQPKTKSVAVFKNGLGFFIRRGKVATRDGWCVAGQVPPAAFGTLAVFSCDEKQTVDIVGSGPGEVVDFDGHDAPKDIASKRKRLEAGKNLKVELSYTYKDQERQAAGKLVSVGPEFVVLDSGSNSFAVPLEGITRMQTLELPLRIHVLDEAEKQPETVDLGMAYLRKGITWIPEYTLNIVDDETAELTLRGTLVNEAEDLIHTDVHLVVGVPHFVHTEYMAPLAVGQVLRTIGGAVRAPEGTTTQLPQAVQTQIMNRAAIVANNFRNGDVGTNVIQQPVSAAGGDLSSALGNLPQMGGAAATDYTVYTKADMTLRRGEKAIITLFKRKIKYSHIYRWTPPRGMEHSLVLHNATDTAWTTGPCLALSDERPLSEDLLKYTPKGSAGEFPVTAAINVAHSRRETEVDRQLKAHSPRNDHHLDLVTLEGKVNLRNYEKRDVDVIITSPVAGKPIEADEDGVISVDSTKLKLTDRAGTVRWRVTLKPGEGKTLTYRYERYVSSH